MRLRWISAVSIPDFAIRAGAAQASSASAQRGFWTTAEQTWSEQKPTPGQPDITFLVINNVAGYKASVNLYNRVGGDTSDYPLHLLEWSYACLSQGCAAGGGTVDRRSCCPVRVTAGRYEAEFDPHHPVHVRVYDHRVAIVESSDVPVTVRDRSGPVTSAEVDEGVLATLLDRVVEEGIALMKQRGHDVDTTMATFVEVLRDRDAAGMLADPVQAVDKDLSRRAPRGALWVSRALMTDKGESAPDALLDHWLRDVPGAAESVRGEGGTGQQTYSIEWLNYFSDLDASAHTSIEDLVAWKALRIAQYYYTAFDLLQARASDALALSMSQDVTYDIEEMKAVIDSVRREYTMLHVEYFENEKFYSRVFAEELATIMKGWSFEDSLLSQIKERINDCSTRLSDLRTRSRERARLNTDVILGSIAFISVFSLLLTLANYGRSLSADARLATYEQGSGLNVADFLATRTTDFILLAGVLIIFGLLFLFIGFRMRGRQS